jgi:hypothetical protein
MSIALWPVFADGEPHELTDEGAVLYDSPAAAPLLAFDAFPMAIPPGFAGSPEELLDLLATQDPTWHDPAEAVAVIDAIHVESTDVAVDRALAAFRAVLQDAANRGTRFHLTTT